MDLYLKAETEIGDLVIDYIEVELGSGKTVSLNWEESFVDRVGKDLYAHYCGICFDKVDANGRLKELKGMKIIDVGTYSEEFGEGQHPLTIRQMEFYESQSLTFGDCYLYSMPKVFPDYVRENLLESFLASSRR